MNINVNEHDFMNIRGAVRFQAQKKCLTTEPKNQQKCVEKGHFWDSQKNCCTLGGCQIVTGSNIQNVSTLVSEDFKGKQYKLYFGDAAKCSK